MSKRPVWLADLEAEVLLGYVGELIDSFNDSSMSNFDRTVLVSVYSQLHNILDYETKGRCDKCNYAYDITSTVDRCGGCGLCHACCDHEAQPTQTPDPQYEY
jgi:hypothetical protein